MTKEIIIYKIDKELEYRFGDDSQSNVAVFLTTAMSNFFSTDELVEFYNFIKEE